MHRFVARANVEHYLTLLHGEISSQSRSTITKLLLEEEDKLSHDLEQLGFAEQRVVDGRRRVEHVRNLSRSFAPGTSEREQAARLLVNLENIQTLLEDFCHRLRTAVHSNGL